MKQTQVFDEKQQQQKTKKHMGQSIQEWNQVRRRQL